MEIKLCKTCGHNLPTRYFSKHPTTRDRLQPNCKSCCKLYREKLKSRPKATDKEVSEFMANLISSEQTFECRTCGEVKTPDQFYIQRDIGKVRLSLSKCKQCQIDYQMCKTFGITSDDYESMLKSQNYLCAICAIHIEEYSKVGYRNRFAVDHCHKTGHIRGLLCDQCNRGIGLFKENLTNLHKAIQYLQDKDIV